MVAPHHVDMPAVILKGKFGRDVFIGRNVSLLQEFITLKNLGAIACSEENDLFLPEQQNQKLMFFRYLDLLLPFQ
jgi:hypothetical protein